MWSLTDAYPSTVLEKRKLRAARGSGITATMWSIFHLTRSHSCFATSRGRAQRAVVIVSLRRLQQFLVDRVSCLLNQYSPSRAARLACSHRAI